MDRRPHWTRHDTRTVTHFRLSSSSYLPELIERELVRFPDYIWRGQRRGTWKLEPTLSRKASELNLPLNQERVLGHLREFKWATVGKLKGEPASDNDWWALGQHYGLATPLLDWTSSPFVAAYFAFEGRDRSPISRRAIWGLSKSGVTEASKQIRSKWTAKEMAPAVELFRSSFGENSRLVSQAGWFTKAPDGMDLEAWVRRYGAKLRPEDALLLKITMPGTDREGFLRLLDRMNINHMTLFPDIGGAAQYCNTFLEIPHYH
jgi:hypothetical protein